MNRRKASQSILNGDGRVRTKQIITPEMAEEFLKRNTRNRLVNHGRVASLSDAIRRGEWVYDGTPISFDTDGVLCNGQHRLMAIVDSGRPVESDVVYGLSPEARFVQDTGLSRKVYQTVSMMEHIPYAKEVTAWWTSLGTAHGIKNRPSPMAVLAAYKKHSKAIDATIESFRLCREHGVPSSRYWGVIMVAHIKGLRVREFADKFATGENLSREAPAFALRRYALGKLKQAGGTKTRQEASYHTACAILDHINSKPTKAVHGSRKDLLRIDPIDTSPCLSVCVL